jgi:5-methylcytosine-specific restriction endonuclease McrA
MNKVSTLVKKCEYCGNKFSVVVDKTKIGWKSKEKQKYCCKNCSNKASAKRVWLTKIRPQILDSIKEKKCPVCGKLFKPHIRNHKKQIYCSAKCYRRKFNQKRLKIRKDARRNKFKDFLSFIRINELSQVYKNNRNALTRYFYKELLKRRDEVGKISVEDWREIKKEYNHRCALCGVKEGPDTILTIDHIIPISRGGKNIKSNIRPLCKKCHFGREV